MSRRILAVIVAALLAVAGAALVLIYVQNADKRAIAAAQPSTVWVAAKLVPAGTSLKDAERTELIVETQVAAAAVPQGALTDVNADNNALLALSDVQPGEYLLAARFGSTPTGTKAIEVPSGKVAVSVELSDPARVGKFVTPGSKIAIYQTYKLVKLGDSKEVQQFNDFDFKGTSLLLEDVLVIGMGETPLNAPKTTTAEGEDAAAPATTPGFLVTVAVSPEESVRLVHGINVYQLYAGLRGSDVKFPSKLQATDLVQP